MVAGSSLGEIRGQDVLAPIEADRWALNTGEILGCLQSAAGTDEVMHFAVVEERCAVYFPRGRGAHWQVFGQPSAAATAPYSE